MRHVLQVLWLVPTLQKRYAESASAVFNSAPGTPADDLPTQLAKVGFVIGTATDAHIHIHTHIHVGMWSISILSHARVIAQMPVCGNQNVCVMCDTCVYLYLYL